MVFSFCEVVFVKTQTKVEKQTMELRRMSFNLYILSSLLALSSSRDNNLFIIGRYLKCLL